MSSKSRAWTYTLFPKQEWTRAKLNNELDIVTQLSCEYMIMQMETSPTTQRMHIQGYIYFKNPRTMRGVKRLLWNGAHLEIARGTPDQNKAYCSKPESRVMGPDGYSFTKGDCPTQGVRTDIKTLLEYAKDHTERACWAEYPVAMAKYWKAVNRYQASIVPRQTTRPSVKVIYGTTGTGKSFACHMEASGSTENGVLGDGDYYVMPTPTSAKQVPWCDGYQGQENVVLEDFDGTINYRIMLRMLDQYPNKMQVKGGYVEFAPKKIWISSNKHPREWYPVDEIWGEGPLWRRLVSDATGEIIKHTIKF